MKLKSSTKLFAGPQQPLKVVLRSKNIIFSMELSSIHQGQSTTSRYTDATKVQVSKTTISFQKKSSQLKLPLNLLASPQGPSNRKKMEQSLLMNKLTKTQFCSRRAQEQETGSSLSNRICNKTRINSLLCNTLARRSPHNRNVYVSRRLGWKLMIGLLKVKNQKVPNRLARSKPQTAFKIHRAIAALQTTNFRLLILVLLPPPKRKLAS